MLDDLLRAAEYLGRPWVIVLFAIVGVAWLSHQLTKLVSAVSKLQHLAKQQGAESKILLARNLAELDKLQLPDHDQILVRNMLLRQHGANEGVIGEAAGQPLLSLENAQKRSLNNLQIAAICSCPPTLDLMGSLLFYWRSGYAVDYSGDTFSITRNMEGGGVATDAFSITSYFVGFLLYFGVIKIIFVLFPILERFRYWVLAFVLSSGIGLGVSSYFTG